MARPKLFTPVYASRELHVQRERASFESMDFVVIRSNLSLSVFALWKDAAGLNTGFGKEIR